MPKIRRIRRLERPRSELPVEQILDWAERFCHRHGRWPNAKDGRVQDDLTITWNGVNEALRQGYRGLPGGSSIAQLLAEKRGHRNVSRLPDLTEEQILKWVDEYLRRVKTWPKLSSGLIPKADGETWKSVNRALQNGSRGLRGNSSLASLLEKRRGVPKKTGYFVSHLGNSVLTEKQILAWADIWHARMQRWPTSKDGPVAPRLVMTWAAVSCALGEGRYGLPGGMSLAQLWAARRGHRNVKQLPNLTVRQILAWAKGHRQRTGRWPNHDSGEIHDSGGEKWANVDMALRRAARGLQGGSSLAQLLSSRCGVRNRKALPKLTEAQILKWADEHYRRTGAWPHRTSGAVSTAPGETWYAVGTALTAGTRGLPGGSSLAQLLQCKRGVRNIQNLPELTPKKILAWADAHHKRTRQWPKVTSGLIPEAEEGQTWRSVERALRIGRRGLPGGSSLFLFLRAHSRVRRFLAQNKSGKSECPTDAHTASLSNRKCRQ